MRNFYFINYDQSIPLLNTSTGVNHENMLRLLTKLYEAPNRSRNTVWADNFFGTSGPDTIVGTENDDKSLDKEVMII